VVPPTPSKSAQSLRKIRVRFVLRVVAGDFSRESRGWLAAGWLILRAGLSSERSSIWTVDPLSVKMLRVVSLSRDSNGEMATHGVQRIDQFTSATCWTTRVAFGFRSISMPPVPPRPSTPTMISPWISVLFPELPDRSSS
jgi:hypothetical protein